MVPFRNDTVFGIFSKDFHLLNEAAAALTPTLGPQVAAFQAYQRFVHGARTVAALTDPQWIDCPPILTLHRPLSPQLHKSAPAYMAPPRVIRTDFGWLTLTTKAPIPCPEGFMFPALDGAAMWRIARPELATAVFYFDRARLGAMWVIWACEKSRRPIPPTPTQVAFACQEELDVALLDPETIQ